MKRQRLTPVAVLIGVLLPAVFAPAADAQSGGTAATYSPSSSSLKWSACPEGLPKGCQLAVLNGDPAKPNADIFLKLPGKSQVPPHKHTSAERIVMMEGTLTASYEGGKPMTLKKGAYAYGPAGVVHEVMCVSSEPCVLFIAFEQPVDLIPAAMSAAAAGSTKKPKKGGC